jgi:hypothetical protein
MRIRGMTEAAFSRTVEAKFMDAPIRLIGVEDFIAMKLFAGSPKDLSDVTGVLQVSRSRIRMPLVRQLVQGYGKRTSSKLEALLKENAS